jgi:arginyl-tRNA synthetase
MENFGASIAARYLQHFGVEAEIPDGGYGGTYVSDLAENIAAKDGDKWLTIDEAERNSKFTEIGCEAMLTHMKDLLASIGVSFDHWFSERTLYEKDSSGRSTIDKMLAKLKEGGFTYEEEGALWFASTKFGDDKDRVLIKSDGTYTYFTPDIAYHLDKFERGNERVINLWGADHHGYVIRMKAALAALGHAEQLEVLLGQLVNLKRGGKPVRMSKRTGEMVTFEELVLDVGADATMYLMLQKSADQALDFDIDVAKKQDSSNPVYYVQYAHARICSILKNSEESFSSADIAAANLSLLKDESELDIARKLSEFSEVIAAAEKDRAPYKLTHYVQDLAGVFHHFYKKCIVLGDDPELSKARLYLCDTLRKVIKLNLALLCVSAPERM